MVYITHDFMFRKKIGILGGMGPVASADTYVELTRMCQRTYGAVQDHEYPAIFLYSLPLKYFSHKGFSKQGSERKKMVAQLKDALTLLENAGSDIIIIDCNTVHYFLDELQHDLTTPIVNLVQTTVHHLRDREYTKVGLLCSQASRDVKLYTTPLKRAGIHVVPISQKDQDDVNEAILAVMSGHIAFPHIAKLDALIDQLIRKGAECIVLGCTEISNLAKHLNHHAIFIDSEALAIEYALAYAH